MTVQASFFSFNGIQTAPALRMAAMSSTLHPSSARIESVCCPCAGKLSFGRGRLVGWLHRRADVGTRGTVLLLGGQSGWGVAYLPLARALARRGLATLLAEGPGQGETRLVHGIRLDVDVVAAYRCFVDRIVDDASLGAPGIWGNSVGGLWAAGTAAADERIRACCVNGALATPGWLPFRTYQEQAAAMLGSDDEAEVRANFRTAALACRPRAHSLPAASAARRRRSADQARRPAAVPRRGERRQDAAHLARRRAHDLQPRRRTQSVRRRLVLRSTGRL
jgi:alpha-beta hydrolase superfamily lysophospholipase